MKGTYIDDTKFYLVILCSDEKADIKRWYLTGDESEKVDYDSVDGLHLGSLYDNFYGIADKTYENKDEEATIKLNIHLFGYRKLRFADTQRENDNKLGAFNRDDNVVASICALRIDWGSNDYREYYDIKIEKIFALDIEKNWNNYSDTEKRAALCFLEKYVLPFETVKEFSKTGKLDMSSFEETYGKGR